MSASRDKGSRLEREVAAALHSADGKDPLLAAGETSAGRLGHLYALQTDVASARFAVECKYRESLSKQTWEWLDQLEARWADRKVPLLVLKRNRMRPLAVLSLSDLLVLVRATRED